MRFNYFNLNNNKYKIKVIINSVLIILMEKFQ